MQICASEASGTGSIAVFSDLPVATGEHLDLLTSDKGRSSVFVSSEAVPIAEKCWLLLVLIAWVEFRILYAGLDLSL